MTTATATIPDINMKHLVILIEKDHEDEPVSTKIVDGTCVDTLEEAMTVRNRMRKRAPKLTYEVFTLVKR